ncbi:MAG: NAD(P)-dependent oxidoreductase [Ramlibacter sp.]|nr:NAD(P)-dependent oxidoreductase [Ramlibacter sp.]
MKILVLGGSGYIGSRLCAALAASGWATPISASSRRVTPGIEHRRVDTRKPESLTQALHGIDAVVNCVAGDAASIAHGAHVLAEAAVDAECPRIIHLSSMSVYGAQEGQLPEEAPLDPTMGWYARAKCEAEHHMASFAHAGGTVVTLRPGCVWGPGSQLWVGRVGRWLRAGRLGDLGAAGDGWSNLVHVDDICSAVIAGLRLPLPPGQLRTYNLAAPDSPRWNEYFVDLALAIGAVPVRRISPLQLKVDGWALGPMLKVAQGVLSHAGRTGHAVPDPMSPGLVHLWDRHLHMDSRLAERELELKWTAYAMALRQSALWYLQSDGMPGAHRGAAVPVPPS